jgi:DHA2 family multidrug resistance protein
LKPNDPNAIGLLAKELGRQAQMVSFLDVFAFISWSFIVVLPLVFLIKNQKSNHPVEAIEA